MKNNEINNSMTDNTPIIQKQPDEQGGIYAQGHIKIFDPETNEVFVQERA